MKLKEMGPSVFHTLKLLMCDAKKIKNSKKTTPVIVSLTTIPYRLNKVHITIRSILTQPSPPEKIILWLPKELKNQIPKSLQKLEGSTFSIAFSPLTCSHKKLIHTLETHPNKTIVVCDDDMIYPKNWLSSLYKLHLQKTDYIICNQARKICYTNNGDPLPYKQWHYGNIDCTVNILPIGVAGVLYPPNALDPMVTDSSLFLELCPKADDLWFKAMALLNNTKTVKTDEQVKLIPIMFTQKVSLKKINVDKNYNIQQWKQLSAYFNFKAKYQQKQA